MNKLLSYTIKNNIGHLSLNNAPVNALTLPLLTSLVQTLSEVQSQSQTKALILSSQFPHVFSAGLDIHYLLRQDTESTETFEKRLKIYMNQFQLAVKALLSLDIPTAAVVSGAAPAGGTVLSLCCDYRIASTKNKFSMGFTEVAVGMAPPKWVYALASHHILPKHVFPCLELGKSIIDPNQAVGLGFLHELESTPESALSKAIQEMNQQMTLPPLARMTTKRMGRQNILEEINDVALQKVYESISGNEFQITALNILKSLKSKKK